MNDEYYKAAVLIQKTFRGFLCRSRRLPLFLYIIQKFLTDIPYGCSTENKDGRINSCIDETNIINLLTNKFKDRIKAPKTRMWYDILIFDFLRSWIPINIKTTTTLSNDNIGNLALCVYAYTDEKLDLESSYDNKTMSTLLFEKLQNKEYNMGIKDYYFLVLNKTNPKDVIVNSILGLEKLYPNINNIPFQICWSQNRNFCYDKIENKVDMFITCLQSLKSNWRDIFITNVMEMKTKKRKREEIQVEVNATNEI